MWRDDRTSEFRTSHAIDRSIDLSISLFAYNWWIGWLKTCHGAARTAARFSVAIFHAGAFRGGGALSHRPVTPLGSASHVNHIQLALSYVSNRGHLG